MTSIKVAGVPEHFNLPWHLCLEKKEFSDKNIDLQWIDVPEGSGKMCQMLREGTTDMAVVLTEGIVRDIVAGNQSKIVQMYVESPLVWGIHVAGNSNFKSLEDLRGKKAAISRFGSGSHLMSFVNAQNNGWDFETLNFEIVNTIDGAVTALQNNAADYFMWERFMTKPLVDTGVFKKIADCPTPWPCFVIAVRNDFLENNPKTVEKVLGIINAKTANFKQIAAIETTLANRYNLKIEDVKEWLAITHWTDKNLSESMLQKIQQQLFTLKITHKIIPYTDIISPLKIG